MLYFLRFFKDPSTGRRKFGKAVAAALQAWSHTAFYYALAPTRTPAEKDDIVAELYRQLAHWVGCNAEKMSQLQYSAGIVLLKKLWLSLCAANADFQQSPASAGIQD